MAGHSKWSSIKHKKAAKDAKRGKLFTRILKEITVAARMGGGDPEGNPRLRQAVSEAKSSNVPGDNITRAIKKGTGELEGVAYEEVSYEGYGPGGVAVMVEVVTDNKNRTVGELRHLLSKHGGNLGENGCVAWMFDKRGLIVLPAGSMSEEDFVELAIELDAEDYKIDEDGQQLVTSVENYTSARDALEERQQALELSELAMIPQNQVELESDKASQMLRLMDALEDHDDVQNVWANFVIDDALMEALT